MQPRPDPPSTMVEPQPWQRNESRLPAAVRVLLYLICWFISLLAVQVAVYASWLRVGGSRGATTPTGMPPPSILLPMEGVSLIVTIIVTYLFVQGLDRRPFRSLGFEMVPRWWAHWALGFGIEAAHFSTVFLIGLAAGWYRVLAVADLPSAAATLLVALAIALPAAAVEEITMRGYVHQTIERRYGVWPAVAVNSGVFALLHAANPEGLKPLSILGLLVAGVYLTVAYLATRQLWLPIAAHAAWNVAEGPFFGLPVSGMEMPASVLVSRMQGPELWTGGIFGPEAGLLVLLTTAAFTPILWWTARTWLRRSEVDEAPTGHPRP